MNIKVVEKVKIFIKDDQTKERLNEKNTKKSQRNRIKRYEGLDLNVS